MIHRNEIPISCHRPHRAVVALTAAVLLSACGNVTSGGVGEVEVLLSSEEVAELQETATAMLLADAAGTSHGSSIEGTLTVRVRSYARRGVGDFVELTDGVQEVTLSIGDPDPVQLARRAMPAGTYDAVRTFFERIEADIQRGLVIDGDSITGVIPVDLGSDGTFSAVALTGFDVVEGAETIVAVEMQSRVWLRLVDAVLRRVDIEDFRRVFRVRVRLRTALGG